MTRTITYSDYLKNKEQFVLIDVRETGEFALNPLEEAKNIPLSTLSLKYQQLNPDLNYALICLSGARSERARQFLASKGYQVVNIEGGIASL